MRRARIQVRPNLAARTPRGTPSTTEPPSSLGLPSVKVPQNTEIVSTVPPAIDSATNVDVIIVTPPVPVKLLDERGNHSANSVKDISSDNVCVDGTLNQSVDHLQGVQPSLADTRKRRPSKQDSDGVDNIVSNKTSRSDVHVASTESSAVSKPVKTATENILIQPAGDEGHDQKKKSITPVITNKLKTARAIVFDLDKDTSESGTKEINGNTCTSGAASTSSMSEGSGGIRNRFAKARPNLAAATSRRQNSIILETSSTVNVQTSPAGPSNVEKTPVSSPHILTTSPAPSIIGSDTGLSPVTVRLPKRPPVQRRVSTANVLPSVPRDQPPDKTKMTMGELIFWNPSNSPMIYNSAKKTLRGSPQKAIDSAKPGDSLDVTSGQDLGAVSEVTNDAVAESGSQNLDESFEEPTASTIESTDDNPVENRLAAEADSVSADVLMDDADKPGAGECEDETEDGMPVPQVRIGPDGSIVVEETSVVLAGAKLLVEQEADDDELIHETDSTVTYSTFSKKVPRRRWGPGETIKFYMALAVVGTDFALMSRMFRNRTRPEIKRKFKKEERCNSALVEKALREGRNFDWSNFEHPFTDEDEIKKRKGVKKDRVTKARKKSTAAGPPKPKRTYVKKKIGITAAVGSSDSVAQGIDIQSNASVEEKLDINEAESAEIPAKPKRKYTKRKKVETPSGANATDSIGSDNIDESLISGESQATETLESTGDTIKQKRKYTRRKQSMKALEIIASDVASDVDIGESVSSSEVQTTEMPESVDDKTKSKRKKKKKKKSEIDLVDAEDSTLNHITVEPESADIPAKQKQKRHRRKKSETLSAANDVSTIDDHDEIMPPIDENLESLTKDSDEQQPAKKKRKSTNNQAKTPSTTNLSDVVLEEEVAESAVSVDEQVVKKPESVDDQTKTKRKRRKGKKSDSDSHDVDEIISNHIATESEATVCTAKEKPKHRRQKNSEMHSSTNASHVSASEHDDETSSEKLQTETQELTDQPAKRKRKSSGKKKVTTLSVPESSDETPVSTVENQLDKKQDSAESPAIPNQIKTNMKTSLSTPTTTASDHEHQDIAMNESVENQMTDAPESTGSPTKQMRKYTRRKKSNSSGATDTSDVSPDAGDLNSTLEENSVSEKTLPKSKRKYTRRKKPEITAMESNTDVTSQDDEDTGMSISLVESKIVQKSEKQADAKLKSKKILKGQNHKADVSQDSSDVGETSGHVEPDESSSNEDMKGEEAMKDKKRGKKKLRVISSSDDDNDSEPEAAVIPEPAFTADTQNNEDIPSISEQCEQHIGDDAGSNEGRATASDELVSQHDSDLKEKTSPVELPLKTSRSRRQYKKLVKLTTRLESIQSTESYDSSLESDLPEHSEVTQTESFESEADIFVNSLSNGDTSECVPDVPSASWDTELLIPGGYSSPTKSPRRQDCVSERNKISDSDDASTSSMISPPGVTSPVGQRLKRFPPYIFSKLKSPEHVSLSKVMPESTVIEKASQTDYVSNLIEPSSKSPTKHNIQHSSESPTKIMLQSSSVEDESNRDTCMTSESDTYPRGTQQVQKDTRQIGYEETHIVTSNAVDESGIDTSMSADRKIEKDKQIIEDDYENMSSGMDREGEAQQTHGDATLEATETDSDIDIVTNSIDEAESDSPICVVNTEATMVECGISVQPAQHQHTSDLLLNAEETLLEDPLAEEDSEGDTETELVMPSTSESFESFALLRDSLTSTSDLLLNAEETLLEDPLAEEDSEGDTETELVMPSTSESFESSALLKDSLTSSDVEAAKFPAYVFKKSSVKCSEDQTLVDIPVVSEDNCVETPCETDQQSFSNPPESNEGETMSPSKVISMVDTPFKEARLILHDICIGTDAVRNKSSPQKNATASKNSPVDLETLEVHESNKIDTGSVKNVSFRIKTRKQMTSLKSSTASKVSGKSHVRNGVTSEKASFQTSRRKIASAKATVAPKSLSAKSSLKTATPLKSSTDVNAESRKTPLKKKLMASNKSGTKRGVVAPRPHTSDEVTLRRSPVPTEAISEPSHEMEPKKISFKISSRKIVPVKTPVVYKSISNKPSIKDTCISLKTSTTCIAKPETGKIPSKKKLVTSPNSKSHTIEEATVHRPPILTDTRSPGRTSTRVKKTPLKYATAFKTMFMKSHASHEAGSPANIHDSSKQTSDGAAKRGKLTIQKAVGDTHSVSEADGSPDSEQVNSTTMNTSSTIIDSKIPKKLFAPYVFKKSSLESSKPVDTQSNDNSRQHEDKTLSDTGSCKTGHSPNKAVIDDNVVNIINKVSNQSSEVNTYKRVHLSSETSDADAQSETERMSVYSQDEESDETDATMGRSKRKSRLLISNELFKQGQVVIKESPVTSFMSLVQSNSDSPMNGPCPVMNVSEDVNPVLLPPPVNNSNVPAMVPQVSTDHPGMPESTSVSLVQNNEYDDYFDDSNDNIEIMICVDSEDDDDNNNVDNIGECDIIARTSDDDGTLSGLTLNVRRTSPVERTVSGSSVAMENVGVVSPGKSLRLPDKINLDHHVNSEGLDCLLSCTVSKEATLRTSSVANAESSCSVVGELGIDNSKQNDILISEIENTLCTSSSDNHAKMSENIMPLNSVSSPVPTVVNKNALDSANLSKNPEVDCTNLPIFKTNMIKKQYKQSKSKRKLSGCFPKYSPPAKTRTMPNVQACLRDTADMSTISMPDFHSLVTSSDTCINNNAKAISENKSANLGRTSECHESRVYIKKNLGNGVNQKERKRGVPKPRIKLTNIGEPETGNRQSTVIDEQAQQSLNSKQETQAGTAEDQQNQLANVLSSLNSSITSTNIEDPEMLKQIVQNVLGSNESRQSNDKPTTLEISAVKGVPSVPGGHLVLVTQKTDDPSEDPLIFVYTLEANAE